MKSVLLILNLVVISHGLRLRLQTHQSASPDVPTPSKAFKAAIFHADDRPLNKKDPSNVTIDEMSFIEMASMVDYLYAEKYGYEFQHLVIPTRKDATAQFSTTPTDANPTVKHPTLGGRHIPWAKVLLLQKMNNAFPKANVVMMHDSDTSMLAFDKSLKEFMDDFTPAVVNRIPNPSDPRKSETCHAVQDKVEISTMKQKSSIWLNNGCRGHFAMMKPGQQATDILKKAWNFNGDNGHSNWGFPWEQAAWDSLALDQTKGLMMIATANQEGFPGTTCKGADIELRKFNVHRSHFQSDSRWMQRGGNPDCRDRIRASLGCGKDWQNKCLGYTSVNTTTLQKKNFNPTPEIKKALAEHEMYHGFRKLGFLETLRNQVGDDDKEIYRVYREMRSRVVQITVDELDALSKELFTPPEEKPSLSKKSLEAYDNKNFKNILDGLQDSEAYGKDAPKMTRPQIPQDSRERNCWCDGPEA